MTSTKNREPLLTLDGLTIDVRRHDTTVSLVRDATLHVDPGEIVCLVGESGSGKSITVRTVMGLTQLNKSMRVGGAARFEGEELLTRSAEQMRRLRGREMAMVFQEPLSALDPVFSVGNQLSEAVRRRERLSPRAETARINEALADVGIYDPGRVVRSYPHQLSGGMCQRVMIAMALLAKPRLLIADEPTTALDVTVQAQILALIDRLRLETDMAVLLVTHDMGVAAGLADRIAVLYAGRVVEVGTPTQIFSHPQHPYTVGLLSCIPPMVGARPHTLTTITGAVPDPSAPPSGCQFHPRCPHALDRCVTDDPPLDVVDATMVACWNPQGMRANLTKETVAS